LRLVEYWLALCRFQKASLYGWAGGSACTVIAESWELQQLNMIVRKADEGDEAWAARQAKAIDAINSHGLVLFHALVQARRALPAAPECYALRMLSPQPTQLCARMRLQRLLHNVSRIGLGRACLIAVLPPRSRSHVQLWLRDMWALGRCLNWLACGDTAQAALACGLLGLTNWKPRFVGFLGVVASAINCYMLFPALPKPAEGAKPVQARKEVQLEGLKPLLKTA
jgi:hypothetical protein